jgi:hypothetical protein
MYVQFKRNTNTSPGVVIMQRKCSGDSCRSMPPDTRAHSAAHQIQRLDNQEMFCSARSSTRDHLESATISFHYITFCETLTIRNHSFGTACIGAKLWGCHNAAHQMIFERELMQTTHLIVYKGRQRRQAETFRICDALCRRLRLFIFLSAEKQSA